MESRSLEFMVRRLNATAQLQSADYVSRTISATAGSAPHAFLGLRDQRAALIRSVEMVQSRGETVHLLSVQKPGEFGILCEELLRRGFEELCIMPMGQNLDIVWIY